MMFTMMMLAAANSTFKPFLMLISRAIIMVSIVRSSSSSTPPSLHVKATAAWSRAKMCIIQPTLIFFIFLSQKLSEGMKLSALLQKSVSVRRRNPAAHPSLFAVRHYHKMKAKHNIYFRMD